MIRKVNSTTPSAPPSNWPVNILAAMMFLIPAVGVPNEYVLQDTLKSAIAAFGILLAAWALVWNARNLPGALRWHWIMGLPFVLCLYALGSMAWSHTYLGGVEALRWFLAAVLLWVGVNIRELALWNRVICGIHIGATVASLWAALQFWAGLDLFPQVAPPASTFANRNFFAEYAVSVIPLSLWLLLQASSKRSAVFMGLSMGLNITAILMTGARSAMVAVFFIVPVIFALLARHRTGLPGNKIATRYGYLGIGCLLLGLAVLSSIPTSNLQFTTPPQSVTPLGVAAGRASTLAVGSTYRQGHLPCVP